MPLSLRSSVKSGLSLDEFGQHAAHALRMDERDGHAVKSDARFSVDELEAGRGRLRQRLLDVRHGIRDVMQAWPAFGQELAQRSVWACRRDELELGRPQVEKRTFDALDGRAVRHSYAKDRGVERDAFVQVGNGDADVVDLHFSS